MKFLASAIAVLALTAVMTACSLIAKLESPAAQPFDAIAVGVAVDAIVGTNPALQPVRAAAIRQVALEVQAAAQTPTVTLTTLESVAAARIQALNLQPAEAAGGQLLVATLGAIVNNYVAKLGTNARANEVQVDVNQVLTWVIAETNRYLPAK